MQNVIIAHMTIIFSLDVVVVAVVVFSVDPSRGGSRILKGGVLFS